MKRILNCVLLSTILSTPIIYTSSCSRPIVYVHGDFICGEHGHFAEGESTTWEIKEGSRWRDLKKPNFITDDGYKMSGWTDDVGNQVNDNTLVLDGKVYKAIFSRWYTGHFESGNHCHIQSGPTNWGGFSGVKWRDVEKPTIIFDSGYIFDGWYSSSGTKMTDDKPLTDGATYTVKSVGATIRGEYTTDGNGDISYSTWSSQYGKQWKDIVKPTASPHNGYRFLNWTDRNENIMDSSSTLIDGMTYRANFTDQINGKFAARTHGSISGSNTWNSTIGKTWGDISKPVVVPDKNYKVKGWFDSGHNLMKETTLLKHNETYYVEFEEDIISGKFEASNHGQITGTTEWSCLRNKTWDELSKPTTKADKGYKLSGWTDSNGHMMEGSDFLTDGMTYTAQFVEFNISGSFGTDNHVHFVEGQTTTWSGLDGDTWGDIQKPDLYFDQGYGLQCWMDNNNHEMEESDLLVDGMTYTAISVKRDFELANWNEVCSAASKGLDYLHEYFGESSFIGFEKTVVINGLEHKVRVIGENHDELYDDSQKTAPLTFELETILSNGEGNALQCFFDFENNKNYLNSRLRANLEKSQFSEITRSVAWKDSTLTKDAFTMLTDENEGLSLKKVKKFVCLYDDEDQEFQVDEGGYASYLFPLGGTEFSHDDWSEVPHAGKPYKYWSDHKDDQSLRIKKTYNGTAAWYWTNTPISNDALKSIATVTYEGTFGWNINVTQNYCVSFCFCI